MSDVHTPPPERIEPCRVLFVDDDENWRELVTTGLQMRGYEVVACETPARAMEEAAKRKFDVAVVDFHMPGQNGIQLMEELKKADQDLEVVLATGDASGKPAQDAILHGAYAVLIKPYDIIELEALLPGLTEKIGLKALVALYEITRSVYANIKLEDLLPDLMVLARKVLAADDVTVMLLDEKKELTVAASTGLDPREWGNVKVQMGSGVAGRVAQWRTGVTINGPLQSDPRFSDLPSRQGVRFSLVYPILLQNDLLGILSANRKPGRRHFLPQDLRHAAIFCSMIGQAIENAKLYDRLYALDQAKDDFISMVSHDLRGPLDAITMITDTLARGDYGEIRDEQKRLVALIKDSARHLAAFVSNILDAAKIRSGSFKCVMQELKVEDFLPRVTQLFTVSAATRGVKLEQNVAAGLGPLYADAPKVEQVVNNLIGNALKFTARGGVIRIDVTREGDFAKFAVQDSGIGIPQDQQHRLFQKFQQVDLDKQRQMHVAGTGLGLAICKTIVEGHRGKIWVESEPGKGSTFLFTIPLTGTAAARAAAEAKI
ncbi:MAG: response regulator [Elusimicrobia bacterium]|nr:response regulator [Elusimicrobiota bacterium]